jgi:hypothetical protein
MRAHLEVVPWLIGCRVGDVGPDFRNFLRLHYRDLWEMTPMRRELAEGLTPV